MALLSKAVLAKALRDKTTLQYANKSNWGIYSYDEVIYPQARLSFPEYDKLYSNNEEFTKYFVRDLNNKNPKLLQKISTGIATKEDQALIDQFNQSAAVESTATGTQPAEAAPTQIPDNAPAGATTGIHNIPQATAGAPRTVFVAQQTPPPGGMEGGTGQGTAATNKITTATKNQSNAEFANYKPGDEHFHWGPVDQTGKAIAATPAPNITQTETPTQPQIKTNQSRFQMPRPPANFNNALRSFGSRTGSSIGVFFQKNIGKHLTGDGAMKFLGKVGNTGVNALSGITNFGNEGGIRFSQFGRFNGNGRGFFGFGRGGVGRIGGKSNVPGFSSGKKATLISGTVFFLIFIIALIGGISDTTSTGQAAPIKPGSGDINTCKFSRAGTTAQFQSPTLLSYIQEAAQKANIPPVILAAFIRVESPGSSNMSDTQISGYSNNCAQSPTGALGIMQIQPPGTTSARGDPASCDDCIDAGAKLVGKTVSTMTRQDYCDPRTSITVGAGWILKKMSKLGYGDSTKWDPAWTTDRKAIEALVNTYYGCLIYGGVADCTGSYNYADDISTSIQNCQAQTPVSPGATTSCPIFGGRVSTPSYNANPGTGHCGGSYSYSYTCNCGTTGRRAKAVDVPTNGQSVVLPTINNQFVQWKLIVGPYSVDSGEGGGVGYTFQASQGSDTYYLDMLHLNQTSLVGGTEYPSGTPVATTVIDHVHMTIGKNLKASPVAGTATDCDPNWIPSDFMCK